MSTQTTRSRAKQVLLLSAGHRIASVLVLVLVLPTIRLGHPFDSSSLLLSAPPPRSLGLSVHWEALIRWDAVHFLDIAKHGYTLEQYFAFQPGLPALLRATGRIGRPYPDWDASQAVLLTSLGAAVAATLSPCLLYLITWRHTSSESFAFLSAALSVFSPAPATLITPSPEAFYSFFTLLGLFVLAPAVPSPTIRTSGWQLARQSVVAASCFAAATLFRANGILLCGFLAWHLWWHDQIRTRSILLRTSLSPLLVLPALPFLASQALAYRLFCSTDLPTSRPWCDRALPSIYSFVQREYWNVGFLRYWTLEQLPNFLLAAPVIALSIYASHRFSQGAVKGIISTILLHLPFAYTTEHSAGTDRDDSEPDAKTPSESTPNALHFSQSKSLLPHILHNLATTALLLFVSHVQISLRFASPGGLPVVWWGAAAWVLRPHGAGDAAASGRGKVQGRLAALLSGLIMWNALSLALYSGFYPPA